MSGMLRCGIDLSWGKSMKATVKTYTMTALDVDNRDPNYPESWLCIDCGVNTGPGMLSRGELKRAIEAAKAAGAWVTMGVKISVDQYSEVFHVRDAVWKKAGMEPFGGCLFIGCLEKRLGRKLKTRKISKSTMLITTPTCPGHRAL